jgi:acetyl-CoA acetyltransferase
MPSVHADTGAQVIRELVARISALAVGLPESVPGVTLDRQCGSAQQAVPFAAQERMAPNKVPARIEVVEACPMTPAGKVRRFRLRQLLAGS